MNGRPWTEVDQRRLEAMISRRWDVDTCAARLNRTHDSIKKFADKKGWRFQQVQPRESKVDAGDGRLRISRKAASAFAAGVARHVRHKQAEQQRAQFTVVAEEGAGGA